MFIQKVLSATDKSALLCGGLLLAMGLHAQTSQALEGHLSASSDAPASVAETAAAMLTQDASTPANSFAEAMDRAITAEHILVARLKKKAPVIETYIQETQNRPELGPVPVNDFYFLGRLDIGRGIVHQSFLRNPSLIKKIPHVLLTPVFGTDFFPRGFAYMIFIDEEGFDRQHYDFQYVRREFLGDVRCIVVDVAPKKGSGRGRFQGRIWIEDRDYNVVRINGIYLPKNDGHSHFDSWRVNAGPGLWLPAYIYGQEDPRGITPLKTAAFRAQTRLWNYEPQAEKSEEAFASMTIEIPEGVQDQSETSTDNSPVEEQRLWERQAEDNVIDRLEKAGLIAPKGDVDQVLQTVLNNVLVTNNINNVDPPLRVRVMLTTPLESVPIGHTVVLSRGLIDVLPDEACLAAVLTHELAHILLGHAVNSAYAFTDRLQFDDPKALRDVSVARTQQEETDADQKALQLLKNSPYKDKLPTVGLFLRMLSARGNDVPHLIRPLLGNRMEKGNRDLRMASLMDIAPELKIRSIDQIAALPLGSRIKMNPWNNTLQMLPARTPVLLTAREKLPFEITPFVIHLRREEDTSGPAVNTASTGTGAVTKTVAKQ